MRRCLRIMSILSFLVWFLFLIASFNLRYDYTGPTVRFYFFHHEVNGAGWRWVYRNDSALLVVLFVTGVSAALLAFAIWARQKDLEARRIAAGLCVCCGYSLRGNISGKCPECGEHILVRLRDHFVSADENEKL